MSLKKMTFSTIRSPVGVANFGHQGEADVIQVSSGLKRGGT